MQHLLRFTIREDAHLVWWKGTLNCILNVSQQTALDRFSVGHHIFVMRDYPKTLFTFLRVNELFAVRNHNVPTNYHSLHTSVIALQFRVTEINPF